MLKHPRARMLAHLRESKFASSLATWLTLAALALYLQGLTDRSMWLDENATLARIQGTWSQLLRNDLELQGIHIVDVHPQIYNALLKIWLWFAGESEFAIKTCSAFVSVLSIPLAFAAGRRVMSRRAGIMLAMLTLLNPGFLWYAQEVRSYASVTPLAMLALYCLAHALTASPMLRKQAAQRWLILGAVLLVGIFTNYLFISLLAGSLVALILWLVCWERRAPFISPRQVALLAAAALVAIAACVIAVWPALNGFIQNSLKARHGFEIKSLGPHVYLLSSGNLFGLNAGDPSNGLLAGAGLCIALVAYGLPQQQLPQRFGSPVAGRLLLLLVTAPFGVALLGLAVLYLDGATYRYLLIVSPAFLLLLVWCAESLMRPAIKMAPTAPTAPITSIASIQNPARLGPASTFVGWAVFTSILCMQIFGTAYTFVRTPTWQDDWRALAQHIHTYWQDGDVVIVKDVYTPERVIQFYLEGLPAKILSADQLEKAPDKTYSRLWFVNTGSGSRTGRLAEYDVREKRPFPGRTNTLELLLLDSTPSFVASLPPDATPLPMATPDAYSHLVGYALHPCSGLARKPCLRMQAFWQSSSDVSSNSYALTIRFKTQNATWVNVQTMAQLPSTPWPAAQFFRAEYYVPIPLGLPPVPFQMELIEQQGDKNKLIRAITQPISSKEFASTLRINTWPNEPNATQQPTDIWRNGAVALVGADLPTEAHAGTMIALGLNWAVSQPQAAAWETRLEVVPLLGAPIASSTSPVDANNLPVRDWPLREPIRQMLSLQLPFVAGSGWYRLKLTQIIDGQPQGSLTLGWVHLVEFAWSALPDAPTTHVTANVGEVQLLGYRLDQPFQRAAVLHFYTYWQMTQPPTRDGVMVLFVFGPDGKPIAQDDNPPEGGNRSTLTYRSGEGLKQLHQIVLPTTAPPGTYRLLAGIYNRGDKVRWEARQNGGPAKDSLIDLGAIELQ
jgi:4-amino-4-deoxy-L-arabinose transferase-like glycosyltransferase